MNVSASLLAIIGLATVLAVRVTAADELGLDYLRDIKPILKSRCYACHGALKQKVGLRLDTAALVRKGGDSGTLVAAAEGEESLLIEAVTGDLNVWRMPPEGHPLSEEQIGLLRRWIAQGAHGPADERPEADPRKHWAFQPPLRPALPELGEWSHNPIDAFIADEHRNHGLRPVSQASRHVLLRRVYLDLIGLPPATEELHDFLQDGSPDAYEKVVDRLLSSPEYAERWARHWMDVWRYSDWYGRREPKFNQVRNSQRHIWRWRDWIVESLERDVGYDRMLAEMLAADELAPDDAAALRATGYLARNYNQARNVWMEDVVEHTAMAFLGLTVRCARCHDHKFDPISQQEYYRFRAIFEPHQIRTDRASGERDIQKDGLPRAYDRSANAATFLLKAGDPLNPDKSAPLLPGVLRLAGEIPFEIEPVHLPIRAWYPALDPRWREEELALRREAVETAGAELAAARASRPAAETGTPTAVAQAETTSETKAEGGAPQEGSQQSVELAELKLVVAQAELQALEAGSAADSGRLFDHSLDSQDEQAVRAALKKLAETRKALSAAQGAATVKNKGNIPPEETFPDFSTGRRLALARWMTDPHHPLTARVAVNQIWMRHFGQPLVASVFDFGRNGQPPTHRALLDWLACEFMEPTTTSPPLSKGGLGGVALPADDGPSACDATPPGAPLPRGGERGWSMKHLHRLMVTSATYRLHSSGTADDEENRRIDPDNRNLWRMNARPMEAEVVRDSLLAVAGALDLLRGGPDLDVTAGESSRRRSLYLCHNPETSVTFLQAFDAANPEECYRRIERVAPQQALALANSELSHTLARELTGRLLPEVGRAGESAFIARAYEQILGRAPSAHETAACLQFLGQAAEPDQATRHQSLVHALLNHNDFMMIH